MKKRATNKTRPRVETPVENVDDMIEEDVNVNISPNEAAHLEFEARDEALRRATLEATLGSTLPYDSYVGYTVEHDVGPEPEDTTGPDLTEIYAMNYDVIDRADRCRAQVLTRYTWQRPMRCSNKATHERDGHRVCGIHVKTKELVLHFLNEWERMEYRKQTDADFRQKVSVAMDYLIDLGLNTPAGIMALEHEFGEREGAVAVRRQAIGLRGGHDDQDCASF